MARFVDKFGNCRQKKSKKLQEVRPNTVRNYTERYERNIRCIEGGMNPKTRKSRKIKKNQRRNIYYEARNRRTTKRRKKYIV